MWLFSSFKCTCTSCFFRSFYFKFENEISHFGINTYRYSMPSEELDSKFMDPGFFPDGPSGVFNLSAVESFGKLFLIVNCKFICRCLFRFCMQEWNAGKINDNFLLLVSMCTYRVYEYCQYICIVTLRNREQSLFSDQSYSKSGVLIGATVYLLSVVTSSTKCLEGLCVCVCVCVCLCPVDDWWLCLLLAKVQVGLGQCQEIVG